MAIKITPTRTGANVELKDIATILSEQNQVLAMSAESQTRLEKSFSSFIQMLKNQEAGDAQDERQANARANNSQGYASRAIGGAKRGLAGITSGVDNMVAGIIPFALGLMRRFIPALLTVGLADQVANSIKDKIGPELANMVESSLTGAGIGFLLGGAKGGIYGAIIGALFSESSRKFVVGMVNNIFNTDFAATGPESFAVVGGAALAAKFLIGLLPKLLPLLLSPTGFIAAAVLGGLAGYFVYQNLTPEQQAAVDKITAPYRSLMSDLSITLLEKAAEASNDIVDGIKEYLNSSLVAMGLTPKFLTSERKAKLLEGLTAEDKSRYDDLERQAIRSSQNYMTAFAGTREEKNRLREQYGLEGTSQNELVDYFQNEDRRLRDQMDQIVDAQQKVKEAQRAAKKNQAALVDEWKALTAELNKDNPMPSPNDAIAYAQYEATEIDKIGVRRRLDELTTILRRQKIGPFGDRQFVSYNAEGQPSMITAGEYYSRTNPTAAETISNVNRVRPPTGDVVDARQFNDNSVTSNQAALVEGGSAMDTGDVYADRMKRMMN